MKKLLFAALLSLAGVGLGTGQASAWPFCHHCCSASTTICCKPYNAFSPSVFGSITADGCCPISFGNAGCGPAGCGKHGCGKPGPYCPPGWDNYGYGPYYCPPGFGDYGPGYALDGSLNAGRGSFAIVPPGQGTPTVLPGAGGQVIVQGTPQAPAGAPAGTPGIAPGAQVPVTAPLPWAQPQVTPVLQGAPNGR